MCEQCGHYNYLLTRRNLSGKALAIGHPEWGPQCGEFLSVLSRWFNSFKLKEKPFSQSDGEHTSWLWAIYTVSNWGIALQRKTERDGRRRTTGEGGRQKTFCQRTFEKFNCALWSGYLFNNMANVFVCHSDGLFLRLSVCLSVCSSFCLYVWYQSATFINVIV